MTTDKSRADALTTDQIKRIADVWENHPGAEFLDRLNEMRAPVEQPSAARISTIQPSSFADFCARHGAPDDVNREWLWDLIESWNRENARSPADERAAFEAWWKRDAPDGYHDLACVTNGDGKYAVEKCQIAWEAWQARAESANATTDAGR
jgi:hypothetical protein